MLDQVVWKDFIRTARHDSRPKQVIKYVSFEWLSHHKPVRTRRFLSNFILQLPEDVCVLEAGSNLVTYF